MEKNCKRKHVDGLKPAGCEPASLRYFNPATMKNHSIKICKPQFLVGRSKEVDFQVTSPRVSRVHCEIHNVGTEIAPVWELIDKNSSLGTFLNGKKIPPNQPTPLKDGDVFYLTDPDLYPIQFASNSNKPAKISRASSDDIFIISKDSSVCEISSTSLAQDPIKNDENLGDRAALIEENTEREKEKQLAVESANKENAPIQDIVSLRQKIAEQEKELVKLNLELMRKDEELVRERNNYEILKYLDETNQEHIKSLQSDVTSRTEELIVLRKNALNEEAIQLKTAKLFTDVIDSELQCPICNEIIYMASILFPCNHVFCEACICMWLKQKKECAVCRTPNRTMVPCRMVDSLIDKLIEVTPDPDFKEKWKESIIERPPQLITARTGAGAGRNNNNRARQLNPPEAAVILDHPQLHWMPLEPVNDNDAVIDLTNQLAALPPPPRPRVARGRRRRGRL